MSDFIKLHSISDAREVYIRRSAIVTFSLPFVVKPEDEPDTYTWHEAMAAFDNNPDSQWRLPTREELTKMYENREKVGGFTSKDYWSSSEYRYNVSWYQQFSDGAQYYFNKLNSFAVRLVLKDEEKGQADG